MGKMNDYYPMLMKPVYKETLWGGKKLKIAYGKADAPERTAESWELSAIPGDESLVVNGRMQGKSLNELAALDREGFWGTDCPSERFPLLLKLIDSEQDLSVQVHPSDANALNALGERGKAEMWYVMDARPHSCLYLGFSRKVSEQELFESCGTGRVLELLNRVNVSAGDVFYIPPGTVHAIGAGITLAEIQQSSDTTFRIFDFNRLGADGKPRQLHWERAAAVTDYAPLLPSSCRANSMAQFPDFRLSELFSCRHFRTDRLELHGSIGLRCCGDSFRSLLCVKGSCVLLHQSTAYTVETGQSYFLPAALGDYELRGSCTLLLSRV